jgi:hypothetical protein
VKYFGTSKVRQVGNLTKKSREVRSHDSISIVDRRRTRGRRIEEFKNREIGGCESNA